MCGKFHIKLNMDVRPIANKYREGKMKRTLKRELKVPEIAERKAIETYIYWEVHLSLPRTIWLNHYREYGIDQGCSGVGR